MFIWLECSFVDIQCQQSAVASRTARGQPQSVTSRLWLMDFTPAKQDPLAGKLTETTPGEIVQFGGVVWIDAIFFEVMKDRPGNRSAPMTVRGDVGWRISGGSWVLRATVDRRWTSPPVTSANDARNLGPRPPWAMTLLLFPSKHEAKIRFPINFPSV